MCWIRCTRVNKNLGGIWFGVPHPLKRRGRVPPTAPSGLMPMAGHRVWSYIVQYLSFMTKLVKNWEGAFNIVYPTRQDVRDMSHDTPSRIDAHGRTQGLVWHSNEASSTKARGRDGKYSKSKQSTLVPAMGIRGGMCVKNDVIQRQWERMESILCPNRMPWCVKHGL